MSRFETFVERIEELCRSNGEKTMEEWLDTQEVCSLLGISPRTLQTYRDNGTVNKLSTMRGESGFVIEIGRRLLWQ